MTREDGKVTPIATQPRPGRRLDRLDLTDQERSALKELAEELTRATPALLDDADWLAAARSRSCRLPVRLAEEIRTYRHDPGAAGTLLISGLPVEEETLPDTPGVRDSVAREATVPAAVAVLLGMQLGELVAYRQEKQGALVQDVVPVPGMEQSQSNAGSVPLEFHIENAFHPRRPDYVGLICLRNDHEKVAGTLVASIRQALPLLTAADREILGGPRFVTAAPPSFHSGDAAAAHAVLQGSPDDPDICVDFAATSALDDAAKHALERLREALFEVSTALVLQAGEMAFVDNRIVLHGRSDFTPRYDGRDRWLHRVYVHLDHRRSRAYRRDNGQVLD